jgi:hypothetical protein
VHVVTPENERAFPEFLEQMWTLGVRFVRVTPVVRIGAASREGRWAVSRRRLRRSVERFRRERGAAMSVRLQPGNAGILAFQDEVAPVSMLVRPSGAVLTDSLHPFAYGHAIRDGLGECWRRIEAHWRDPRISGWAGSLRSARKLGQAELVPYRDAERPVGEAQADEDLAPPVPGEVRIPAKADVAPADPDQSLAAARDAVRELALARRYRLGGVSFAGGGASRYVRANGTGKVVRLNGTASTVVDALDGGTPSDAVERLAERFRDVDRGRLEEDVLATGRVLEHTGIVVAGAG